jgi:hypothetical protein
MWDIMSGESPQNAAGATWSLLWSGLGTLSAAAVVISLVKSGFAIELHRLPAKMYEQYVWLRDMLFEPIVWVLRYFGLTIPAWLKDVLMGYGLVAAAHWRIAPRELLGYKLITSAFWPLIQIVIMVILRMWPHPEDREAAYFVRQLVLRNLLVASLCAVAFFLWNYLQSVFGPTN